MRSSEARPGIANPNRPDDEQSHRERPLEPPGEPLQSLRQLLAGMGLNSGTRELADDPSADHPNLSHPSATRRIE
jgi:hypothetical protein